jgi:hypothetical protein
LTSMDQAPIFEGDWSIAVFMRKDIFRHHGIRKYLSRRWRPLVDSPDDSEQNEYKNVGEMVAVKGTRRWTRGGGVGRTNGESGFPRGGCVEVEAVR